MGIKTVFRLLTNFCVIISLFSIKAFAFDIDESVVWPNVAQGHHQDNNNSCHQIDKPQLTMQSGSRINGTLGEDLAFCSNNEGSGLPSDSCDTASNGDRYCNVSGSDIRGIKLNGNNKFQDSDGKSGGVGSCSANENIILGDSDLNQFDTIKLYSTCTLTMSSLQPEYYFKEIEAGNGAKLVFPAGDYWVESLKLGGDSEIVLQGDVRLFVNKDAQLNNNAKINVENTHSLQLITYGNLTLNNDSVVGGNIYSDETLTLNNNSIINGRVTSKYLTISGGGQINDTSSPPQPEFHIQFGKATANNITFDSAFPDDVTPLIFLMPTIEDDNSDGPASVLLKSVSAQGFTWSPKEPASPSNRYVKPIEMPEIHWIAVTAGSYDLPNDITLIAGSIDYDQALFGSSAPYTSVTLPATQNVVLNQIQTQNNDCWFTSTSTSSGSVLQLALDTSEVYSNSQCQPGNLNNDQIQNETIGYLSLTAASGTMTLNGVDTNYHFGQAQTFTDSGTKDVSDQCSYTTPLIGFKDAPILVAGKNSRLGGDGGWLRRCQLTNDKVSMVIDEDTYKDNDRKHRWENYSFVAFEKKSDTLTCFLDDFDRTDLGDDWVVSNSRGSFTPAIVSNRLQVTQAKSNQATSSTYQRLFPAKNNLVTIEFDHYAYGGSGADGIAFVLSDSAITPQAGAYGGPLGYGARTNENGFSGGWLGFGIDEFGNFSREGGSSGSGSGPGRRKQSVAVRGSGSGTAGYPYLHGSCNDGTTNTSGDCLSPTIDKNNVTPAHRYRITVDSQIANQSLVKVERDSGSGFVEIISEFDAASFDSQADLPDNFLLSLTGSTGGATNIHEIDGVKICALNSSPIGVQIHHFEYSYSDVGLTCAPKTLSIKACANADCTATVTDSVTAILSPETITDGGGWVGGNVVTFSGGEKTDLQLRRNTPGTVSLGVSGSTPSTIAFSKTLCRINGGAASENCNLTFADSGFIFDVPDKLANKPTDKITIRAVKTSDVTQQCIPLFSQTTKNVDFWSSYIDPITPINGQSTTVNSKVVSKQESAATTLELAFDTDGKAELIVNYSDAGKMQLDAKYTGTGDEQGLIMLGSDEFVSFPVGLCIAPEDSNAKCAADNSTCDVYKKAGESFNLIIQGKAWESDGDTNFCDNINTPNYAHDDIVLGHQLIAPSGGVLGAVGVSEYDHIAQTTNTNTVSQSVTEVGVFKFSANPPNLYLGSSFYDIPLAESPSIGRFVPDRFVVSSSSVLQSCGSITYMDQPFDLTLTLSALNTGTYVTQNYQGDFAKATASLVGENANDGIELSSRLSALPIDASYWVLGKASVGLTYQANFNRTVAPNADGPFNQLDIGVQVFDNEATSVSFVASADMRPDTTDNCVDTNDCTAKRLSTQDLRHGRVVMDNTYGPESEILRMPMYAQYWNGSNWVTNFNDSCTQVTAALDGSESYDPSLTTNQTVTRSDGGSIVSAGQLNLLWQNTGSKAYRGQVTAPLQVDDWLKWYWNWEQVSPTTLYDPRASAFLGRYRGHDRIIYWREVSQ
ncbi:DUF6701 domain-containing protein [Shewanella sp. MEBiC00475]|uniref:DUF6701 domain-containing protein n=1 Tax=Shewanella sp. MEBiC00475 TaxID=2575361 RepID=UPI0010C066E8|nr:DUF6701 domain-containing protein [Shewanella sp. MEBiC00475]